MSSWNHAICDAHWVALRGHDRPERLKVRETEICCWCHGRTRSGIYLVEDPAQVPCRGDGGFHDETVETDD